MLLCLVFSCRRGKYSLQNLPKYMYKIRWEIDNPIEQIFIEIKIDVSIDYTRKSRIFFF